MGFWITETKKKLRRYKFLKSFFYRNKPLSFRLGFFEHYVSVSGNSLLRFLLSFLSLCFRHVSL